MTFKLAYLTLLAAFTAAASAQTTSQPATPTTHATHHTAASASTTPPNIPKVVGIPRTLYAIKYVDIKVGTGPLAEERKFYTVRYTGWLKDGTKFDSSYDHTNGEPIVFPYGAHRVITGWDTGFQGMRVGGKRRLFIPYQLAYGEAGRPPVIPAKADLIFDLELVSQSDTPPQPKQPAPTATPNPAAKPAEPAPDTNTKPSTDTAPSTPATQPTTPPHPESL